MGLLMHMRKDLTIDTYVECSQHPVSRVVSDCEEKRKMIIFKHSLVKETATLFWVFTKRISMGNKHFIGFSDKNVKMNPCMRTTITLRLFLEPK